MTDRNKSYYQSGENPIKALWDNSIKGTREEFLMWVVKRYPEFLCLLVRRNGQGCNTREVSK